MMWRKIDSHPKDEKTCFLVWNHDYDFPVVVYWDPLWKQIYRPFSGEAQTPRPTHWMPLPEPPHDTH